MTAIEKCIAWYEDGFPDEDCSRIAAAARAEYEELKLKAALYDDREAREYITRCIKDANQEATP